MGRPGRTDEELKELVAENVRAIRELRAAQAESMRETLELRTAQAESRREARQMREESDRQWQDFREEMRASRKEIDRAMYRVEQAMAEIGRLHNRFGDDTEALCRPSLTRTLHLYGPLPPLA